MSLQTLPCTNVESICSDSKRTSSFAHYLNPLASSICGLCDLVSFSSSFSFSVATTAAASKSMISDIHLVIILCPILSIFTIFSDLANFSLSRTQPLDCVYVSCVSYVERRGVERRASCFSILISSHLPSL
ncbi:hypothetical protein EDC96DRAFT_519728 [Choanephora cucurbitarum]|nr:hypothetical protein EDC96DRAFT_519728 [Choanephora cucurbitarum]